MSDCLGPIDLFAPCIPSGLCPTHQLHGCNEGTAYAVHSVYVLALGPPDVEIVNGYISLSGSLLSELLISNRSRVGHTRHHSISNVLQGYRVSSRAVPLQ